MSDNTMKKMKKILTLALYTCCVQMTLAEPIAPDANTPTELPKNALTCPAADKLEKNPKNLRWHYGDNFKSFDTSFAKEIKKFVGAQWQGVKVGKVECIYQPENAYTFTVIVYFGHLAHEPTSSGWSQNKGGYRNCISLNPKDCYFIPLRKKEQGNVYDELEQLKPTDQTQ